MKNIAGYNLAAFETNVSKQLKKQQKLVQVLLLYSESDLLDENVIRNRLIPFSRNVWFPKTVFRIWRKRNAAKNHFKCKNSIQALNRCRFTSTCQFFPKAVTTRSSIGRRQAPQIGIPILSWQRRQYNSPLTSRASDVNSLLYKKKPS